MADAVKYPPIEEFISEGYLHEMNRLFFHPLGLALEVRRASETKEKAMHADDLKSRVEALGARLMPNGDFALPDEMATQTTMSAELRADRCYRWAVARSEVRYSQHDDTAGTLPKMRVLERNFPVRLKLCDEIAAAEKLAYARGVVDGALQEQKRLLDPLRDYARAIATGLSGKER